MVLRGQGAQSGAIGEVRGPKVVPLELQRASLRAQRGPVERSRTAKVDPPRRTVCKTYGNGPDPTATRTKPEAKVYLSDKTYD